ncbi:unnamed protein product [marine sediment metagenome]|uniref:CopG-like ribbon-helix-helix domain-containing protein n=1 Tax=marine sediment metagenome TaxID=412755 RepID=X1L2Y7_9ZZZZ
MNDQKVYDYIRFNFVLSPKHKHALELMAENDRESMSTILRGLILQEAKLRGLWLPVRETKPAPAAPPPPDPTENQVQP